MNILIIEGDNYFAQCLKKSLESHKYSAEIVKTTEEANDRIFNIKEQYKLIVLDLESLLTIVESVNFCKQLRSSDIEIPIIVLNKNGDINDRMKLLESGATDYMVKPFSIWKLISKIDTFLKGQKDEWLKVGRLRINTSSKKVYIDNEQVILTPKEFMILEYMVNHLDQILSREKIFEEVWDFDSRSMSNIVDVHVKNLRKKIVSKGGDGNIETVWGSGYRFSKK